MAVTHTASIGSTATVKKKIAIVTGVLGRFPLPVLQLLFRLAVASVFLKAGLNKLSGWEFTVQLFMDEYKVPILPADVAAVCAATTELSCSLLLILGLFTRLATLPLLGMILVIQVFVYPDAYSEHLTWGSILIFLLTRGGGTFSLDRLLGIEPRSTRTT
jgi:putative oxidoreductase